MTTEPIGVYVHIPLCVQKCNYCDFCSFPQKEADWRKDYINALCEEIDSYKERRLKVDTIFFGGGTPSLLSGEEFYKIYSHLESTFDISEKVEFTVEANPKTLSKQKLLDFKSVGVNRISMGVQSFCENELKILGRIHNDRDALEAYELVRSSGISNVNIDLMYGIPEQTLSSFSKTLDVALSLSPEHISLYGLILEEGTQFWNKSEELVFPKEDAECDMYYLAQDKIRAAGYRHYEISNYSKPDYECRHNLKYWRDREYVGVGVCAYSYLDGARFGNSSEINEYLSKNREKYRYTEQIDKQTESYEYVMLALRLSEGFSLIEYKNKFGLDFLNPHRKEKIDEYIKLGFMDFSNGRITLTDKGFYVSNTILTELL